MKEIIMATTNPAKISQMSGILEPVGISVLSVPGSQLLPEVNEDGDTPLDNARKKALAFAKYLNKLVFSTDNALYIDALSGDPRQPGMRVRRIPGSTTRPTDHDLLVYYSKLIKELGDNLSARWDFAVCVASPSGKTSEIIISSPTILVSQPSSTVLEGYPLESLQLDPESGKLRSELSKSEISRLWYQKIGAPLVKFFSSLSFTAI